MRITFVTEGSYPFHTGGVSTWADQVVRGLPQHRFDIVAISSNTAAASAFELPANVDRLLVEPVWVPQSGRGRVPEPLRRDFHLGMSNVLRAVAEDREDAVAFMELGLRQLQSVARQRLLFRLIVSERVTERFVAMWGRSVAAGMLPWRELGSLNLAAAVRIVQHVAQAVRVLGADPPRSDVVHAVANGHCGLVGLAQKWRRGTPLVVSEHGVFLRERILCYRKDDNPYEVRAAMVRFYTLLSQVVYRTADLIVPVSNFNARWARSQGAPADRVKVIYNGIDCDAFPGAATVPDRPTLIWVGRVDPLKDIETLLQAFARIADRRAGTALKLYGPVPSENGEYLARCGRLVNDLRIDGSVTFMGPTSPTWPAYHEGSAVMLSSISEGLPYTVLEAMATGRATVSTEVGGVGEAVGDAGLLVPPRDPEAMARAALRLLDDAALQRDLGRRARERVHRKFRLQDSVSAYGDMYGALPVTAGQEVPA